MNAAARSGKQTASSKGICAKTPTALTVPVRVIEGIEGVALGFRQEMLTMGDDGNVSTGAGLGTDFIILQWGERQAVVRGSELLRAWVASFAPDEAARFPDEIVLL